MRLVALDIETMTSLTPEEVEARKAALTPPATHKKAETIAAWLADAREHVLDKAALSALSGSICAVALGMKDTGYGDSAEWRYQVATAEAIGEKGLLSAVLGYLERFFYPGDDMFRWITFGGRHFDFPYLLARLAVHGLKTSGFKLPVAYYDNVDLSDTLGHGSLDDWSRRILGEGKAGDSAEIPALAAAGNWAEIHRRSAHDIRLLTRLHDRIVPSLAL